MIIELNFYTDYGYVKVLKSEYESPAMLLNCYKDDKKLKATIKVNFWNIKFLEK